MGKNKIRIEEISDNPSINIALDTIRLNKQALIFANTKNSAEKTAEDIAHNVKTESQKLKELSEEILNALSKPTKQCERLSNCVKKGIAFHHAGLVSKQRELIEDNFRSGLIKIICSTPTLAYGVDLPAFRSIIKDLRRLAQGALHLYLSLNSCRCQAGQAGRILTMKARQ